MLADSRVSAVLPVVDLERARKFYEEKLGLRTCDAPGGVMFQCGLGSQLVLYQRDSPTKADHTAAGWEVDDIEKVVKDLREKGVLFEQYEMTDEQGIANMGGVKAHGLRIVKATSFQLSSLNEWSGAEWHMVKS